MYVIDYTKQERAVPAAITIVVHLALIYALAAGLGVVPSPLQQRDITLVDVPPEKIEPQPIELTQVEPGSMANDFRPPVPDHPPIIEVEPTHNSPIVPTEMHAESGNNVFIEAPITNARIKYSPEPPYPLVSRAREEEGTVLVMVMISPYGTVSDAQLEKSSGFARLDEAALKAVRSWKFAAAMRGSQAIATWVTVPVKFVLNGRG